MSFVCLWIPRSPTGGEASGREATGVATSVAAGALADAPADAATQAGDAARTLSTALLAVSPHVAIGERGVIWVDARGLPAREVAEGALAIARRQGGEDARVGVARVAIVAEVAATLGRTPVTMVSPDEERAFLAPYPLRMLAGVAPLPPSPRLSAALVDVGIERCGELAALTLEEIEVRFGAEGVAFWRLARAEDARRLFAPGARALASASLAWEEYALRDTERLAFVLNRLAGTVCAELGRWGEAARAMTLTLALTSRVTMERQVRASHPTASRATWVRLLRAELERLRLRDAVVGLSLRVDAAGELESQQGDIFDRGLQSARAVEEALTRLLDDQQATIVGLTRTADARPEARAQWRSQELGEVLRGSRAIVGSDRMPSLSLQLLPSARQIAVATTERRDQHVPVSYREREEAAAAQGGGGGGGAKRARTPRVREAEVLTALGPDRISGGAEVGAPYARDYYQCVTAEGLLVLLYRDVLADRWYLHGWWD